MRSVTARAPSYEAPPRPTRPAPRPPARAPRAPATCTECSYLKSLLAEQRSERDELATLMCIILGVQKATFARARREAEPFVNMPAERIVLGLALHRPELAPPADLFVGPTHRELALAIQTGVIDPILLRGEMRGYRRGLRRMAGRCTTAQLRAACEALSEAAERRQAIACAERALVALRRGDAPVEAAAELRGALQALGEGVAAW